MRWTLLTVVISLGSAGVLAADTASLLDGTWRLALGDHDRMLSVNAKDQKALYCDGGDCSEGAYTIDRVVGSTVFLSVRGPKPLHLVIYIQDENRISVGEQGRATFPFKKDAGNSVRSPE
jgi:hypothetical protein